jgi:hypothetical protein
MGLLDEREEGPLGAPSWFEKKVPSRTRGMARLMVTTVS